MQSVRAILAMSTGLLFLGCSGSIMPKDPSAGEKDPTRPPGEEARTTVGPTQWRRLSADQYRKIVKDVLAVEIPRSAFLADTKTGLFASNTKPVQESEVDRYANAADLAAEKVDVAAVAKCGASDRACAEKFVKEVGARLYRRSLRQEESESLLKLFDLGVADGFKVGTSLMVQSLLQSPSFLYLVEFGESDKAAGLKKLGPYEMAARLALLLWNSAPDATLLEAAGSGKLGTADQVKLQAERMMNDSRFGLALADFHLQLFRVNKLVQEGVITKESLGGIPGELRTAMFEETSKFITDAVANKQATIENFFTAKHSFPPDALMTFNKIPASEKKANGRVEFTDGRRAGLLTMSGFMTAEPPTPTVYGAVQRGKVIREDLLCQHIPAPPPGLNFIAPPDAETTPQRVLLEQHQSDPTCKGCHSLMDSVGFAFENYDAFGRYRKTYPKGEAVDPSGVVEGGTDMDGKFTGPEQLGTMLARSGEVRACMAAHWFRYAVGREPTEADEPSIAALTTSLAEGAGDIPTALLTFVQTDAFRFIQGVQ